LLTAAIFLPAAVLASTTDGTILLGHQYAWSSKSGWLNFGLSTGNVHVTDSRLSGYIWSGNNGWINLAPSNGGVSNTNAGILSGSAWGENLGWINFSGTTIDTSGRFHGTATGDLSGTVNFDCAFCDVTTDWRPETARIICGNGRLESGEQCDAGSNNGSCPKTCSTSCATNTCSSGGGGGGGSSSSSSNLSVSFSGLAYPQAKMSFLKDGQLVSSNYANASGTFSFSMPNLIAGNYIFSIYAEDNNGRRSVLSAFPITLSTQKSLNDIFIAPTISLDKNEVKQGDVLSISGQSAPKAEIALVVSSTIENSYKIIADANGFYSYSLDTTNFPLGQYLVKTKASANNLISTYSDSLSFVIGDKTVEQPTSQSSQKADLNQDKKVNLIDFSIEAYWYKRSSPPASADLNSDGKVDLIDLSIMAYYWTG